MQTEITVNESELNMDLIKMIKNLLKSRKSSTIKITISDKDDYFEILDQSISQAKSGEDVISFTLDELMAYNAQFGK